MHNYLKSRSAPHLGVPCRERLPLSTFVAQPRRTAGIYEDGRARACTAYLICRCEGRAEAYIYCWIGPPAGSAYYFFIVTIVIRHKTLAAARWALLLIVRAFFNDAVTVAVWTGLHVCLPMTTRLCLTHIQSERAAENSSRVRRKAGQDFSRKLDDLVGDDFARNSEVRREPFRTLRPQQRYLIGINCLPVTKATR